MSTFNFRYAQVEGQKVAEPFAFFETPGNQVAQSPKQPNSFQTVAQNPMFQGMSNPSNVAFNYAQNQMDPRAKQQYEGMYSNLKQQITTGLNNFPSSIAYNPNLYNWTIQFINYLVKNYDSVIIWMLEKGLTIQTWMKNPTLAIAIKAAEKYPDRFKVIQNVGTNIIQRLQSIRGIKNVVGFIEAGRTTNFNQLLADFPELQGAKFTNSQLMEDFLRNPKSIPYQEQKLLIKELSETHPESYAKLAKALNFNEILSTGARLGENASVYKQAAVKTFSGMSKALPQIAEYINKLAPFLDVAISSVDFIDWLGVWGKVGWDKMSRVDQIKFGLSALKAFATICYFIPGLQLAAPFINMAISILQTFLFEGAEGLMNLTEGVGFGGAAKVEAIQNIASQAVGTPPKDPQAIPIYNMIFVRFKAEVTNQLSDPKNKLTPEQIVKKITGGNVKTYFDKKLKDYYESLPGIGIPGDMKFANRWLLNPNDTRNMDLWNSLSGSVKQIISIGKSFAQNSIGEDLKNTPSHYYDVSNLPEHSAAGFGGAYQNWVSTTSGQPTVKANKAYNNRRYITCPST